LYYVTHDHAGNVKLPPRLSRGRRMRAYHLRGLRGAVPGPDGSIPGLPSSNPAPQADVLDSAAGSSALPWEGISSWWQNISSGTLSPAQVSAINTQNTSACVAAGGDPTQCGTQSAADTQAVLALNNALPSQAWWDSPLFWVVVAASGGLLLYTVFRR
jgi:hypothetical protein